MKIPQFELMRQYEGLKGELLAAAERVLSSGNYILGSEVDNFENEIAAYLAVPYAMGVANGTDALELALKALNIGPGDRVLTSPFTFFATASAILSVGAQPVFADIDPQTFNLSPEKVHEILEGKSKVCQRLKIKSQTIKAILPVHLYGQAAEMNSLLELASAYHLPVIEDAAQALGAEYYGKKVGTLGTIGCFSFFPTKNLGAIGDAGLVVTKDKNLAEKLRLLRVHGSPRKYEHELVGTNSRLDALQAAFLRLKLKFLNRWIDMRIKHANHYRKNLEQQKQIAIPVINREEKHSFHQYTIRLKAQRRDALKKELADLGIETAIYYPKPVHLQDALSNLKYQPSDFPEAERASHEVLSLPMYPELTETEISSVSEAILQCLEVSQHS